MNNLSGAAENILAPHQERYVKTLFFSLNYISQQSGIGLNLGDICEMVDKDFDSNQPEESVNLTLKKIPEIIGCRLISYEKLAKEIGQPLPLLVWTPSLYWCVIINILGGQATVLLEEGAINIPLESIEKGSHLIFEERAIKGEKLLSAEVLKANFLEHKKIFAEGIVASILINLVALAGSFFTMNVYDRVIPTKGYATLTVLAFGAMLAIVFEFSLKIIRSGVVEHALLQVDTNLSRNIFSRLLSVRLDQLPNSVGTLSAQMRGYEHIKGFLSATTFYLLVDVPFGLFFLLIIWIIGGAAVALVPLCFLFLSLAFGFAMRRVIDHHAQLVNSSGNLKTGLLVEVIEGAETIKSFGGGRQFLSKWMRLVHDSSKNELMNRKSSELSAYITIGFQQLSYILLVSLAAYMAAEDGGSYGAVIAASMLSGRVLGPIAQIPGLVVQKCHAMAALHGLHNLYALEGENFGVDVPSFPEILRGNYFIKQVKFLYGSRVVAVDIENLKITDGEKIGVIGPVGSGKSTLLRLLSGIYKPTDGDVMIDQIDMATIDPMMRSLRIGYVQQDHRLFRGTLRKNLLLGVSNASVANIELVAKKTGLLECIKGNIGGLDSEISEGGKGLSVGQRQLVAITRLLLNESSKIWLLDEPTASMDVATESKCIDALKESIGNEHTVVLVTHKLALLEMVDRLIYMAQGKILLDGPRNEVLLALEKINA